CGDIAWIGRRLLCENPRVNFCDWTGEVHECIEHVQSGAGHAAARRLARVVTPATFDAGRMLIAEITLDMQDLAQGPVGGNPLHLAHARKATLVVAKRKWHSGLFRGLDGAFSFTACERKRLLAPDRLARRGDRGDLLHMKRMGSCEKDCLYARVGDRFFEIGR